MVNLIKLYDISRKPDDLLQILQEYNLIPAKKSCPNCTNLMEIKPMKEKSDGFMWRCRAKYQPREKAAYVECDTKRSIRDGTFFGRVGQFGGGSNLSIGQVNIAIEFKNINLSLILFKFFILFFNIDGSICPLLGTWIQIGGHCSRSRTQLPYLCSMGLFLSRNLFAVFY